MVCRWMHVVLGSWLMADGREADSGLGSNTYRGDSASSRDGADGARRLSESVPEHIKRGTGGFGDERRAIATRCNWREGRLGSVVLPLQESKWRFLREDSDGEQSLSEGESGLSWSNRPIRAHCAVLPGTPEAALTIY